MKAGFLLLVFLVGGASLCQRANAHRPIFTGYSPDKQTGKLWLSVGKKESFSLEDLKDFPTWTKKIQAFHEVKSKGPEK